jgi:hypothetical protein
VYDEEAGGRQATEVMAGPGKSGSCGSPFPTLDAEASELGQHRLIDFRHDRYLYASELQLAMKYHPCGDGRRQADRARHGRIAAGFAERNQS